MRPGMMRLLHLREQTEAVGVDMIEERARFAKLRKAEPTRAISAFNLFQTPPELAARMVDMLPELGSDTRILEPSAGLGRIYRALRKRSRSAPIALVDSSAECCGELYRATEGDGFTTLHHRDFLSYAPEIGFDCIVMNPPFKMGADVRHIRHAIGMLRPGGVLVSLCFDGARQNKHLQPIADTWEPLGPDAFKSEGTRASIVLMTCMKHQ